MKIVKACCAAGVMAAALGSAPASATPVSTPGNGKALVLIPLTFTRVQDLDFGTIVSSAASGTVTVDPAGGPATPTGGVTIVGTTAAPALFAWAGTPNQQVTFSVAPTTTLPLALSDGNGNTVTLNSLNISPTTGTVDTSRVIQVGVGGTITVGANQPDGVYTNTFDIQADYN